jgi:putative ATPase
MENGLFDELTPTQAAPKEVPDPGAPLAARMRPSTLEEFVGQNHLVGEGQVLRRAVLRGELTSAIFWGPPGCGKSTLAAVIANTVRQPFESLSAVTSGTADLKALVERARIRRRAGQKTLLFVDEIHRWNKAQQDGLLPHVEDGTVTLIGATTENPSFSIVSPLLSRARVVQFKPLEAADIAQLLRRAVSDTARGLGSQQLSLSPEAEQAVVRMADGDARSALNALESASKLVEPGGTIGLAEVEQALQHRAIRYDRDADEHYDTISAFIKSVRGSDPDAALYWLAKMLEGGEDPRFLVRRLLILASEDIGNADPQGLVLAAAAAQAVERVGMPEAALIMSQITIYLACAPKSNACTVAIGRARADIRERGPAPVPLHLRSTAYPSAKTRLHHGEGYLYPHDFPGGVVEQLYVPEGAVSGKYYEPTDRGWESRWRSTEEPVLDENTDARV